MYVCLSREKCGSIGGKKHVEFRADDMLFLCWCSTNFDFLVAHQLQVFFTMLSNPVGNVS